MLRQREHTPRKYALHAVRPGTGIALQSSDGLDGARFVFSFEVLRPGLFRTTFTSPRHPLPPWPSAGCPTPTAEAMAAAVAAQLDVARGRYSVTVAGVTATVDWTDAPVVTLRGEGEEPLDEDSEAGPLYADVPFRSYAADGDGVAHYSRFTAGDLYLGLGEKAAPMNLACRRFSIATSDTFGYDVYATDPLYKHIPLLLHVSRARGGACVGLFSTAHSRGDWNVGAEVDGLWGPFKTYRQACGGLEQFLLVGASTQEVVRCYADLVGYPLLVPRYMLGYVAGGMRYSMEDGKGEREQDEEGEIRQDREGGRDKEILVARADGKKNKTNVTVLTDTIPTNAIATDAIAADAISTDAVPTDVPTITPTASSLGTAADAVVAFLDQCAVHGMPVSAFQLSSGYTVSATPPHTRNVFTWHGGRFADPRAFAAACHRRGVRVLANVKPYVLTNHPAYRELAAAGAFLREPTREDAGGGGDDDDDSDTPTPGIARLWSAGGGESGDGSHLDFTSRAGAQWWTDGCRALLVAGIDGLWNDNNEFNVLRDDWECALEGWGSGDAGDDAGGDGDGHGDSGRIPYTPPSPRDPYGLSPLSFPPSSSIGLWGRALHTELMARASHAACVAMTPDERPLVLTRSATTGTLRFACASWSGDNVTSWAGLRGANALSCNAGVSLLACYGHDVGGFEGPQPTPELLVRWVQLAVHQPRFAINCFKTSRADRRRGAVIEPWMHPAATPLVRASLRRRYALLPYTAAALLRAHCAAVPPLRWTGWGFEAVDSAVWAPDLLATDAQFWFGDALLVAGVYAPGVVDVRVYLPRASDTTYGFLNIGIGADGGAGDHGDERNGNKDIDTVRTTPWLASGRWHNLIAPWTTSIPVLARCGAAVPVGRPWHTTARVESPAVAAEFPDVPLDDWRGVEIFPPPTHVLTAAAAGQVTFVNTWLEDDGISAAGRAPIYEITLTYRVGGSDDTDDTIVVSASAAVAVSTTALDSSDWAPLWLPNGLDVLLPFGETRAVVGAESRGRDVAGRRVYHIEI